MQKVVAVYFQALRISIVLCLAGMVVLVFGNVVLRYGFNSGITESEEIARLLFVYMTFLGAIVAMHEHLHLGIDSLIRRLPTGGRRICLIISLLLMLFATWLFLKGSWQQALINLDVRMPVTGISMAIFYGVGLIFSVSTGVILLVDLYRALAGNLSSEEMVMVQESEDAAELQELDEQLHGQGFGDRKLAPVKPS